MKHRQTGVGLVELMISLVLGLLVSALALQMFLGSRSSLSSQEALSYLQESARYVSYRLQPLMRNVGYAGCGNVENIEVAKGVSVEYDLTQPLSAKKKKYKEVVYWELILAYADKESEVPLAGSMASKDSDLKFDTNDMELFLNNNKDKVLEKTVLINDCKTADLFTLKDDWVSGNTFETVEGPSRAYGQSGSVISYVYPVKAWRLVLADQEISGRATGNIALFIDRTEPGPAFQREELVAGVGGLEVTFGVDTDNDGIVDQLGVMPDSISTNNWGTLIRRIEIALTLQSEPGVVPGGANSGRLERTFNMTFSPRNLQLRGKS
ncbi:hypothetical protein FGL86_06950 [Pistricoccus aurantiacus]|uniref:Prepilin-type N-terminal cleavage/methylation domain-containing protein n=1 Tax=Pistricoccus aurantiacus TaxID=1883414 RepID=A0A5B8SVR1_9GAMM|nr:prepilin-type N-terminal cleavage/methylation domain-containing protein [Pistricoccus aurantiacus]QEA38838.1 hypothetical protein FGL86_06950 [Pistricoccus aurantiacus]